MALVKLDIRPGVDRNSTEYENTGGWYDSNRVRFRSGHPESIGGWQRYSDESFIGMCRSLFRHTDNLGINYTALGTTVKMYVETGGQLSDVTPIRATASLTDPFDTTDTLYTITVTDVGHGANAGDYIIINGSTAVGGITDEVINAEHVITSVVDADTYTITVTTAATSTANGGGAGITINYLYYSGTDATVYGTGWGTGTWGRSTWGSGSTAVAATDTVRIWNIDNFGEDLIVNPRNGPVFYWDATTPDTRMVNITTLGGATNPPEVATKTLVSQNSRHVIAFGCDPLSSSTQNKMLVRWSDQEDAADWTPSTTNQAGDYQLNKGSRIVTALQTRSDILIFTDKTLYNMQYIGGQLVFGFQVVADNIYIAGAQSAVAVNDVVYWMGASGFYAYDGRVQPIQCSVQDFVLVDIDWSATDKIFACSNMMHNEVTWFYQSVDGTEIDSYVTYNYVENLWYFGHLARTAWIDDPGGFYPIAASTDGYLYTHEKGVLDESVDPPVDIGAWIESSPIEIGDGDKFSFIDRLIPDIDFHGSIASSPSVTITLTNANWPGGAGFGATSSIIVQEPSSNTYTTKKNVRMRGRSVKIKVQSSVAGTRWRSGHNRIEIREDGAR